jgi:hypothetical protein
MTARRAAGFPSGQEYAGVPPAATSAAQIHLEQEHEDHHRRDARDHLGPPRPHHHLGPLTPMSPLNLNVFGTDTPERGKFSKLPDVGRAGVRRTRWPSPPPVGWLSLAASARRPAQAGLTVRAALTRSSPRRGAGAAGRKRGTVPTPRAPGRPPAGCPA